MIRKKVRVSLFALAISSVLAVPLLVDAGQSANEDPQVRTASLYAMRGDHAVVAFADESGTIQVHGTVYDDATHRPLREAAFEVVRFHVDDPSKIGEVTLDQVAVLPSSEKSVVAKRIVGSRGEFVLSDLSPGNYSLQIDWDQVPADSDVVRWDLKWVKAAAAGPAH